MKLQVALTLCVLVALFEASSSSDVSFSPEVIYVTPKPQKLGNMKQAVQNVEATISELYKSFVLLGDIIVMVPLKGTKLVGMKVLQLVGDVKHAFTNIGEEVNKLRAYDSPPNYNSIQFFGAHPAILPFGGDNPEFDQLPTLSLGTKPETNPKQFKNPCCCFSCLADWYTSLLRDDGFTNLSMIKFRRLLGIGLAEMFGVAFFLATGCGNLVSSISGSEPSHINTVLSFALGISAAIIIFAPISGCMLNPCLNVTWLVMGHMSLIKFVYYTIFQVIGAYLGVAFIAAVTPNIPEGPPGFCTTHPNPDVSTSQAFAVEFFLAFFLSLGLCNVLDKRASEQHGLVFVKFAVLVVALVLPLAKYEGGSVNPARSLGPALLTGDWDDQWLYWTAPNLGAGFAAVIYRSFFDAPIFEDDADEKTRENNSPI